MNSVGRQTPGPWKYEPSTQARYSWLVLTADFDEDANRGVVLCRTSDCISEADARLIAAAPDLLAACEAVVAHYQKMSGSPNFPIADKHWIEGALMARAAIAKAKGH